MSVNRPTVFVLHATADRSAADLVRSGLRRAVPRRVRPTVILVNSVGSSPLDRTVALLSHALAVAVDNDHATAVGTGSGRAVLALLAGELRWSPDGRTLAGNSLPARWSAMFEREPRWVDLTWLAAHPHPRRDPRYADAMADLAGPLIGMTKEQLVRADHRRARRVRSLLAVAAVTLVVAVVATLTFTVRAVRARDVAQAEERNALNAVTAFDASAQFSPDPARGFLLAQHVLGLDANSDVAQAVVRLASAWVDNTRTVGLPTGVSISGVGVRTRDGAALVSYYDGSLRVFLPDGTSYGLDAAADIPAPAVLSTADGRFLVVSGANGNVLEVDADLRRATTAALRLPATTTAVAWSTRGDLVISGDTAGRLTGWDLPTGSPLWTVDLVRAPVVAAAVSASGQLAAATTNDGGVHLVALSPTGASRAGSLLNRIDALDPGHVGTALAFVHDDGRLAVGAGDGRVRHFTVSPFMPVSGQSLPKPQSGQVLDIVPVGHRAYATGSFGTVAIYDTSTATQVEELPVYGGAGVFVRPVPQGLLMATRKGFIFTRPIDADLTGVTIGERLDIAHVMKTPAVGGAVLAFGGDGASVRQLPSMTASPRTLPASSLDTYRVSTMDIDGLTAFLQLESGKLTRWNSRTGQLTTTPVPGVLSTLSRAPASDWLVASTADSLITWRVGVDGLTAGPTVPVKVGPVAPAWLGPDRLAYLTADQTGVVLVSLPTGATTRFPVAAGATVLAASADGSRAAVGTLSGEVLTVAPATGATSLVTRVQGVVTAISFVNGDRQIAFGLHNGYVGVMGLATHSFPQWFGLSATAIVSIVDLHDGRVATSDFVSGIHAWRVDVSSAGTQACQRLGRPFTHDEAERFGVPAGLNPCLPGGH